MIRSSEYANMARPSFCTDDHLQTLDELRAKETDDYFIHPAFKIVFPDVPRREASAILRYWKNAYRREEAQR